MTPMVFINLPVADLTVSMAFYQALNFTTNPLFTDDTAACMMWSEAIHVMLLTHDKWRQFTSRPIPAAGTGEVMLALSLPSREAVDVMNRTAAELGGTADVNPVQELGFMYSRAFTDPDGHLWEATWMDPAAAEGETGTNHREQEHAAYISPEPEASTVNEATTPADGTGTVHVHRVLRAPVERVYKAFTDKRALEYWLPPYGFTGRIHDDAIDVRVGGGYKMSFINFGTGRSHAFTVNYVELVPNQRLRHTDRFDDGSLVGAMMVTIELQTVSCGTEIRIEQAGIPARIPLDGCYLGWQESLQQLARLVEPSIADAD